MLYDRRTFTIQLNCEFAKNGTHFANQVSCCNILWKGLFMECFKHEMLMRLTFLLHKNDGWNGLNILRKAKVLINPVSFQCLNV